MGDGELPLPPPSRYNLGIMGKITVAALSVALVSGCGRKPFVTEDRLSRGLVLVLPGIEGKSVHNVAIRDGLAEGGVDCAIEIRDWTACGYLTFLYNLRAEKRNRAEAAKIARTIEKYQDDHPDRPVTLVGQSGGGAMVAWIAEAMGPDRKVDGVIMLAAALSPDYRLDKALAKSRRGIVSFYSPWDWVFLGVGTFVFGTSDGSHASAAGRVGFNLPTDGGTDGCYRQFFEVKWNAEMIRHWNLGGHVTSGSPRFVAHYVAPLVNADRWDADVVSSIRANSSP